MGDTEPDGPRTPDVGPWRRTALLLLVAAAAVFGVLVATGPPDQEAEASAVLRTRVRADDTGDALRSPEVLRAIARSTGASVAELRDGLTITEAQAFRLTLRYQPEAPAGARLVAAESIRRIGSVLLDDALTRADRALVTAQEQREGVRAAERVAQDARDAREATFDVRVETATVRPGWWTAGIATVAVLLLLAVTACVLAARRHRAELAPPARTPVPKRPLRATTVAAPETAEQEPAAPALTLEQLEQRLAELTQRSAADPRGERAGVEVSA